MGINEQIASDITTSWQIKHNTLWDFESIEEDLVKVLEEKDLSHQKVVEGLNNKITALEEAIKATSNSPDLAYMIFDIEKQLSEKDARIKELQAENGNLVNSLWSNSQLVPVKIAKFEVLESLADELAWALVITHDCATYRGDGECDGCLVSRVLTKHTSWKGGKK